MVDKNIRSTGRCLEPQNANTGQYKGIWIHRMLTRGSAFWGTIPGRIAKTTTKFCPRNQKLLSGTIENLTFLYSSQICTGYQRKELAVPGLKRAHFISRKATSVLFIRHFWFLPYSEIDTTQRSNIFTSHFRNENRSLSIQNQTAIGPQWRKIHRALDNWEGLGTSTGHRAFYVRNALSTKNTLISIGFSVPGLILTPKKKTQNKFHHSLATILSVIHLLHKKCKTGMLR